MTVLWAGMLLEYTLKVEGRSLRKFAESQLKNTRVWHPEIGGRGHRVVLGVLPWRYITPYTLYSV